MGDIVFNIAKGRVNELVLRTIGDDPSTAEIVVMLCTGTETDGTLQDFDTFAAILAGNLAEATFTNYAREILDESSGGLSSTTDDTNNRRESDASDITYSSAGGAANNTLTRLIFGYDASGAGTDSGIVPLTAHDFAETTTGSDLIAQFASTGWFRAA